jgi:hypothetical protein
MTGTGSADGGREQAAIVAALGYLFPPVVPLVVLSGDVATQPELARHARQALLWTVGFVVLLALSVGLLIWLVRLDFLAICLAPVLVLLPFVPGGIWAKRAYMEQPVRIRLVSRLAEAWGRNRADA